MMKKCASNGPCSFGWAEDVQVDIFFFKILVMLVCRGRISEKSQALKEMITCNSELEILRNHITWNSPMLRKAFYCLLRVAVLIPD